MKLEQKPCTCTGCKQRAAWLAEREKAERSNRITSRVLRGLARRILGR